MLLRISPSLFSQTINKTVQGTLLWRNWLISMQAPQRAGKCAETHSNTQLSNVSVRHTKKSMPKQGLVRCCNPSPAVQASFIGIGSSPGCSTLGQAAENRRNSWLPALTVVSIWGVKEQLGGDPSYFPFFYIIFFNQDK